MFNIAVQFDNPPERRAKLLRDALKRSEDISDPVPTINLQDNERIFALLCLQHRGWVSHICWGRKGQKAGTGLTRLNFERIHKLQAQIDVTGSKIPAPLKVHKNFFVDRSAFSDAEAALDLVDALRKSSTEIDQYIAQSIADYKLIDKLRDGERQIVRYEHDATEMALRIAGITPRDAYVWSPTREKKTAVTSFFSGLKTKKLSEDDIIQWDLRRIPGFSIIHEQPEFGHCVLRDGGQTIHLFHANKNKLENTLGVDLIYFNENHHSFVMVQYKGTEKALNTDLFRFPNEQLTAELERMDRVTRLIEAPTKEVLAQDYRLCGSPFFLKFCPRDSFNPDNYGQIQGMIVPRDYWRMIEEDTTDRFVGPLGGKFYSFNNSPRYFDNTQFIAFLREGWIGTKSSVRDFLVQVLTEIIEDGHSVVFATKLDEVVRVEEVVAGKKPIIKRKGRKKKVRR